MGRNVHIGDSDAQFKAQTLFGEITPETMDRSARGNGVIVHWERGRGEVFNAATCEWVMGLTRRDWQVEQITRNVMMRFGQ